MGGEEPAPELPRASQRSPKESQPRKPRLLPWAIAIAALLAAGVAAGMVPRLHKRSVVAADTRELAITTVSVTTPMLADGNSGLTLSGELKPSVEASIYARASGYVRRWYVDLGARVEAGQLLAELDTPELDRELSQARAELNEAEASRNLAETTAKRWSVMLTGKSVSAQESEEKQGDLALKKAGVQAAAAKVQRLEELAGFSKITAPFRGTITARKLDVGQLVNAGGGQELFKLAQTDSLRVFVRVPQSYARTVGVDQPAEITTPELPGRKFPAKVVRTAGAIDVGSRTLLTELEVENSGGELFAGSYALARLPGAKTAQALTVPSNVLLFRAEGTLAAVVGGDNHVRLRPVVLGRDFGPKVEIAEGIAKEDRVVLNPADSLVDGAEVRVADPKSVRL
jgi:RND family efflux transporter MFP subunit